MSIITYIIYVLLFIALLIEPHIIKGHVSELNAPILQSLTTAIIVGIAWLVYRLHQHDIARREQEAGRLKQENTRSLDHIIDLSAGLGLINRRASLLHVITTDVLSRVENNNKSKQALIQELLAVTVVSLSQAEWGILRFVDVERGRTVSEFSFAREKVILPSTIIGNKTLMNLKQEFGQTREALPYHVVTTTDHTALVRCHYIFPRNQSLEQNEHVIQNVVDQAQLLFKYLHQ